MKNGFDLEICMIFAHSERIKKRIFWCTEFLILVLGVILAEIYSPRNKKFNFFFVKMSINCG